MDKQIQIEQGKTKVVLINGSLRSYIHKKQEWIHNPEDPGWSKSDDEMFPVIGSTASVDHRLETPSGSAYMDQHGLLRELKWTLIGSNENSALFEKRYTSLTKIRNSKFPEKSTLSEGYWPYSFVVRKHFTLEEARLHIQFEIEAPAEMPYQLGYHPAFRLESSTVSLQSSDQHHGLEQIFKAGNGAYPLMHCNEIMLNDGRKRKLRITTEGFGHFMCWTEVKNMLCIEPITHYPAQFELSRFKIDSLKMPESGNKKFVVHLICE